MFGLDGQSGRKVKLGMIGVAIVLALAVIGAVLKRFGIDLADEIRWAMLTVAGLIFGTEASIAYEDARKNSNGSK